MHVFKGLRIEPRTSYMLSTHSITELHSPPLDTISFCQLCELQMFSFIGHLPLHFACSVCSFVEIFVNSAFLYEL